MNISINSSKLLLGGVGLAAGVVGLKLGAKVVHDSFYQDVYGDPRRPIEANGNTSIIQVRSPQGGADTIKTMLAGAAVAAVGGALALHGDGLSSTGLKSMLRVGAGVALAVGGTAAVAGASMTSAQWSGADFLVDR